VIAEEPVTLPPNLPTMRLDHHHAHAAAAFLTSPLRRAAALVCDDHSNPGLTVWLGDGAELTKLDFGWQGPAFATVYSRCAEVLGLARGGQEHRLEALARLGQGSYAARFTDLWRYEDRRLHLTPGWEARLSDWAYPDGSNTSLAHLAEIASSIQSHLGALLLAFIRDVRPSVTAQDLCLAGGFFYNTYFNTVIQRSGCFDRTFVPVNPGNAGLAAGAALAVACGESGRRETGMASPFLGPEFEPDVIKATLDNCKLSYELATEQGVIDATVEALRHGSLVGWFQGRMEWGPRALGHRSILADPRAPYVLDNLNVFLKKRDRYRAYGLSARVEEVDTYFIGPPEAPLMEFEYAFRNPDLLRPIIPEAASTLRVQSVMHAPRLFRELHRAYAQATGVGVLVNTSFNGFLEPIVCSPRDAVRVFYGTGLDMLVIDRFLVRK
jgi:carbamoyltransferase